MRRLRRHSQPAFDPASLVFGRGGFYGDMRRDDKLFTTSAGSTNSINAGDAVGRIERLSGTFNFTQATGGAIPSKSFVPAVGMFNILAFADTPSEAFESAAWTKTRLTASDAFSGIYSKVTETATTGAHLMAQAGNLTVVSGRTYTTYFDLMPGSDTYYQIAFGSVGFGTTQWATFNNDTHAFTANVGVGVTGSSITLNSDGSYRIAISAVATSTTAVSQGGFLVFCNNLDSATLAPSYLGNTDSYALISRFTLAPGTIAQNIGRYQKVTTRYNVSQTGVRQIVCLGSDAGDHMTSGVDAFGAATQGLYAAAGENWSLTVAWSTFGTGTILAQTNTATAADKMFQIGVTATALETITGGTVNSVTATFNDGAWNVLTLVCANGVLAQYLNRSAVTVPTVGAAAAEVTNIRLMARATAGTPAGILTGGYVLPGPIIDRALSASEAAQVQAYWCSLLQIP